MNELIEQFEQEQSELNDNVSNTFSTINNALTPFHNYDYEAHNRIEKKIATLMGKMKR